MEKEQIAISRLQYADDSSLFLDEGMQNLRNLVSIIHCFELVSRMKIYWQKCCLVGINSNIEDYKMIYEALNCPVRKLRIEYLGVCRRKPKEG